MIKKLSAMQIQLIALLNDGEQHSGSDLGTVFGISRSAICKQVKQLKLIGVPIVSLPTQGYCLTTPLVLLDDESIHQHLIIFNMASDVHVYLYSSVNSTNSILKQQQKMTLKKNVFTPTANASIDVCCAETQTQGRGRFNRYWHSPFGENIYCSSKWHFNCALSSLSGLSLVVSLAIVATLNDLGIINDISIKWPNDILWQGKKLCGSLIEINAESNGVADVIIGIGLNVNSDTNNHPLPDKPWCSLYEITNHFFDRNLIIANLISQLQQHINQFKNEGLSSFMSTWKKYDYLCGQMIAVTQPNGILNGKARGIDEHGQLILEDGNKVVHYLSSGDTSIRTVV